MGIKTYIKKIFGCLIKKNEYYELLWLRVQWLNARINLIRFSDLEFTKKIFRLRRNREIDLVNPVTFEEKLMYLKLSNRDPLITKCSDKHLVREYVTECGLGSILKNEYTTFDTVDEIILSRLPSPCYLKCNNASGMNCVYDKSNRSFNEKHFRKKFKFLLKQNPYRLSREWNYKNIKPCIICEEVLHMPNPNEEIPELQFFCCGGKPIFLIYNLGLADKSGKHADPLRWALWMDGSLVESASALNHPNTDLCILPNNFSEMVEYARILSKPFPHVRVDLFNIHGRIYFNELTFYSGGGFNLPKSHDIQQKCGDAISLDGYSIAVDAINKAYRRGADV